VLALLGWSRSWCLNVRRVPLTAHILQVLRPALIGAKGTIKSEIVSGVSHLYQTDGNNLYVVIRPEGDVMVVVAIAGSRLYQSRQEILNFARFNQFKSIRFHTKHPEHLERALTGLPFALIEVRKALFGNDELIYKLELM